MQVQGVTNALIYIPFLAMLRKATQAWYSRLELRSMDSFRQLKEKFVAHFDACWKIPCDANSLFYIRQQDEESFWDYVA